MWWIVSKTKCRSCKDWHWMKWRIEQLPSALSGHSVTKHQKSDIVKRQFVIRYFRKFTQMCHFEKGRRNMIWILVQQPQGEPYNDCLLLLYFPISSYNLTFPDNVCQHLPTHSNGFHQKWKEKTNRRYHQRFAHFTAIRTRKWTTKKFEIQMWFTQVPQRLSIAMIGKVVFNFTFNGISIKQTLPNVCVAWINLN